MPCFTYKSRRTDALPFSDDEMMPCHILLSPTRVGGKFTWPEIVPRESSSAEIAAKTTRVSLIMFSPAFQTFDFKLNSVYDCYSALCPKVTKTSRTYVCRRTMSACLLTRAKTPSITRESGFQSLSQSPYGRRRA